MRVLIIKLTSMGDLMHALPALTDAVEAIPGIEFDWVVDEAFAEVPQWHPAVKNVITTSHRRWKKSTWQTLTGGEPRTFYQELNASDYDVVVDMQN
ncbi:MAG: lipopolysaccharide heptosyltransferase I, partial [Methylophaga sp.]